MSREVDTSLHGTEPGCPAAQPAVLAALREATGTAHARLDAAFGALQLDRQEDLVRFLRGHAIGIAATFAPFRAFVEDELGLTCPDYREALAADLAALGEADAALPAISTPWLADRGAALGLAYVVAGSRLGLAVLRKRGYAGRAMGRRSRYMEDESGVVIWRVLLGQMREHDLSPAQIAAACTAALATFACFERAFELSTGIIDITPAIPETDAA